MAGRDSDFSELEAVRAAIERQSIRDDFNNEMAGHGSSGYFSKLAMISPFLAAKSSKYQS